jgi:hypothetical protein
VEARGGELGPSGPDLDPSGPNLGSRGQVPHSALGQERPDGALGWRLQPIKTGGRRWRLFVCP